MMRTVLLMFAAAAVFPGCDHESRWGPWPDPADRRMRADHAPAPYTAEQIRAGCPDGRRSTYYISNPGESDYLRIFRFEGGDEEGTTVGIRATALDGRPLQRLRESRAPWTALQSHASFPTPATEIGRETICLAPGWFHCMRYTVRTPQAPPGSYSVLWFARELPGPPVRMERYVGGALTERMTLYRQHVPPETK